jgi:hypothetical protein
MKKSLKEQEDYFCKIETIRKKLVENVEDQIGRTLCNYFVKFSKHVKLKYFLRWRNMRAFNKACEHKLKPIVARKQNKILKAWFNKWNYVTLTQEVKHLDAQLIIFKNKTNQDTIQKFDYKCQKEEEKQQLQAIIYQQKQESEIYLKSSTRMQKVMINLGPTHYITSLKFNVFHAMKTRIKNRKRAMIKIHNVVRDLECKRAYYAIKHKCEH